MTMYGNQGLTVSVPVEDERIQKDALYALEVDEMLFKQSRYSSETNAVAGAETGGDKCDHGYPEPLPAEVHIAAE